MRSSKDTIVDARLLEMVGHKYRMYEEALINEGEWIYFNTCLKYVEQQQKKYEKKLIRGKKVLGQLERTTLRSLYYRITDALPGKVLKQRMLVRAYSAKVTKYISDGAAVRDKIEKIKKRNECSAKAEDEYKELYSLVYESLKRQHDDVGARFAALREKYAYGNERIRRINDALDAGNKAFCALVKASDNLNNARGLGLLRIVNKGKLVTMLKYHHIFEANSGFSQAQFWLREFAIKIDSAISIGSGGIEVDDLVGISDLWFNDAIGSLFMQARIKSAKVNLQYTAALIGETMRKLSERIVMEKALLDRCKMEIDAFVVEFGHASSLKIV